MNNQKAGVIETRIRNGGEQQDYRDLAGRLVRSERRDSSGQLLAGACTRVYAYEGGRISSIKFLDCNEHAVLNNEGYALCNWTRSPGPDGGIVIEESYFDEAGRPVRNSKGFSTIQRSESEKGVIMGIKFYDPSHKPCTCQWLGTTNVASVEYSYLQGVTPMTFVCLFDGSGNLLQRRQLSGQTGEFSASTSTTYGSRNYQYTHTTYQHSYLDGPPPDTGR